MRVLATAKSVPGVNRLTKSRDECPAPSRLLEPSAEKVQRVWKNGTRKTVADFGIAHFTPHSGKIQMSNSLGPLQRSPQGHRRAASRSGSVSECQPPFLMVKAHSDRVQQACSDVLDYSCRSKALLPGVKRAQRQLGDDSPPANQLGNSSCRCKRCCESLFYSCAPFASCSRILH
jgi:hypothetical protein